MWMIGRQRSFAGDYEGLVGDVQVYDEALADYVPEPATLMLLGLGGLCLPAPSPCVTSSKKWRCTTKCETPEMYRLKQTGGVCQSGNPACFFPIKTYQALIGWLADSHNVVL